MVRPTDQEMMATEKIVYYTHRVKQVRTSGATQATNRVITQRGKGGELWASTFIVISMGRNREQTGRASTFRIG